MKKSIIDMKWSHEGNIGRSSFARVKEIAVVLARTILALLKVAAIQARCLLKKVVINLSKKGKVVGKQKGKEMGYQLRRLITFLSIKANTTGKQKAIVSAQLLKQLAIILVRKTNEAAHQTIQIIIASDIPRKTKSYLTKDPEITVTMMTNTLSPPPDPETTIRRITLNDKIAEEIRKEIGIDCQAIDVNSLPVEHKPYYSYIFPMSSKIVTNRGCIRVKSKCFDLIQIIQRN
jgi:hypothetical protein